MSRGRLIRLESRQLNSSAGWEQRGRWYIEAKAYAHLDAVARNGGPTMVYRLVTGPISSPTEALAVRHGERLLP